MASHDMDARNDTLRVINSRHSIRMFLDAPVADQDILTLLQAANQAPSAHNQQSWRFIVIKGEKKRGLTDLVNERAGRFPKSAGLLLRMASRTLAGAPVAVAIVNTGELIEHGQKLLQLESGQAFDFFRTMEIQSSAAAVQNLLLAATSLGLATVWLGILFLIKDDVLQFLGEPQGEFMAVIPVGYAARACKGPEKRPVNITVRELK